MEKFYSFVAICKSFLHKIWGCGTFSAAKASNLRKFSPRKLLGEPTYGLLLSLIASWHSRFVQHVLHQRFFPQYSLDTQGYSATTLLR